LWKFQRNDCKKLIRAFVAKNLRIYDKSLTTKGTEFFAKNNFLNYRKATPPKEGKLRDFPSFGGAPDTSDSELAKQRRGGLFAIP